MTIFSFTADSATDNITITGHPFVTGDGPVQILYSGSHTAPLLSATNYWVIRIDANTIRLATSQANANATTAINITVDGTGPRYLLTRFLYQAANGPPFPFYRFSADSGTDRLTIAGHGLVTGDGPVNVFGYGTGAAHSGLPAPLAPDTNYWVIRDSADAIRLATSSALAVAGTAINLTTNGTGRSYIGIGLPYGRPRSYAQGSNIFSDDFNMIFDAEVGSARRPREVVIGLLPSALLLGSGATVAQAANPANASAMFVTQFTAAASFFLPLIVEDGDVLEDVIVEIYGNGTTDLLCKVLYQPAANITSVIIGDALGGSNLITNPPATWTKFSIMPTDRVLMSTGRIEIQFDPNATGLYVSTIRPVFSRTRSPRG
jgi:hypothetical protein